MEVPSRQAGMQKLEIIFIKCDFVLEWTCECITYGGRPVFPSKCSIQILKHKESINKVKGNHRSANDAFYDPTYFDSESPPVIMLFTSLGLL